MNEVSINPVVEDNATAELSALYISRLSRCIQISSTWRLYLAHNAQLRKLLEHVTALSYRDCLQHGFKVQADRLVQSQSAS
jgi:hypothetical protein